ncbi:MAG: hypothetical protein KDG50_15595 [Chromatiales bacterium]|nr:hypothetical protein [Chromatiales bacterium]
MQVSSPTRLNDEIPMPYYLFEMRENPRRATLLESHDDFQQAKKNVRALRAQADPAAGLQYKIMFAKDELAAERLVLTPPKKPMVYGEE